jgi:hypothetical protein
MAELPVLTCLEETGNCWVLLITAAFAFGKFWRYLIEYDILKFLTKLTGLTAAQVFNVFAAVTGLSF